MQSLFNTIKKLFKKNNQSKVNNQLLFDEDIVLYQFHPGLYQNAVNGDETSINIVTKIYERGKLGIERNYSYAERWYKYAIEKKHKHGWYRLGIFYENYHKELKIKENSHVDCYKQGEKDGDGYALYKLGEIYEHGKGVEKNLSKAIEWHSLAVKKKIPWSMNALGRYYLDGTGVEKNDEQALEYYRQAALQGNSYGMKMMGVMYGSKTLLGRRDFQQARTWFIQASKQRDVDAIKKHAFMCKEIMEEVEQQTPDLFTRIGLFSKYAKGYFSYAATYGDAESMYEMGNLYRNGHEDVSTYTTAAYEKEFNIYLIALDWYKRAAEKGYSQAMYIMGKMYMYGCEKKIYYTNARDVFSHPELKMHEHILKRDRVEAKKWLEDAAKHNHSDAMLNLALLHHEQEFGEIDYTKAKYWYEQATKKENTEAMIGLAKLYEKGNGVAIDHKKAYEWYQKAKEKKNTNAIKKLSTLMTWHNSKVKDHIKIRIWCENEIMNNNKEAFLHLALLYDTGLGGKTDYKQAIKYYQQIAENTYTSYEKNGKKYLEKLTSDKENKEDDLYEPIFAKDEQINRQKIIEWYDKIALNDLNEIFAVYRMAHFYRAGQEIEQNYEQAKKYYIVAAEYGYREGISNLGDIFYYALGEKANWKKAKQLYERARAKGSNTALQRLGSIYERGGFGISKNLKKAKEYYELAIEKRNTQAILSLATMYAQGKGVAQDTTIAKEYFLYLAEEGNTVAMCKLGWLYSEIEEEKQYTEAIRWYEQAAKKSDTHALEQLSYLYQHGPEEIRDEEKAIKYLKKQQK